METLNNNNSQGWKNILIMIIPYFVILGVFQLIGCSIAGLDIRNYKNFHETTFQLFIIEFFSLAGTFFAIWIFRKYLDNKSFISLGFSKRFIFKDTLLGIMFGFIIVFIGFVILIIAKQITISNLQFNLNEFILSIGLFFFIATTEELFVRGYFLNNLMVSFDKNVALIISSLFFSLLHIFNPNFNLIGLINLFLAGIFLGLGYNYTKNLWFSIALHFSWNFFQGVIFGFNVSGRKIYSLLETTKPTYNIWNGGDFGFEGSVLSILFQLIAIGFVILIFRKRNFLQNENRSKNNKQWIQRMQKSIKQAKEGKLTVLKTEDLWK